MSMSVETVCATCRLRAPSLGDAGYMGRPSPAEHSWDPEEEIAPSFGYIFAGLEAIGMVSWDLVRYRDFLLAHDGHQLTLVVDGDSDVRATNAAPVPPPDGAIVAAFEQKCYDCRRRRWSKCVELVIPRSEKALSGGDVELFLERACGTSDACHAVAPFGDEETSRVAAFLRQHGGHRVCTSLLPEAQVPA